MRKAGLMVLSGIVACAAGVTIATPAGAAASASARPAPGVTGKIVIKARVVRQCDGDRGSTAKESTMRFTDVRINGNGRVRVRQHLSGFEYASANDLDGRVAGRSIRGWLRSIDSDHGMGSGPGGTDCSTGRSRLSPPPKSWVRFSGRSTPGKPRVFRVTTGKPEVRPTGNYRGPRAKCAGRKADYVGTERGDRIRARPGSVVVARAGDDHVTGKNLTVCAGPGNDRVTITRGAGLVYGGTGNDTLKGGPRWDVIYGGAGNDLIWGGAGANTVYGGEGNDRIDGGKDGIGWLFGGPGSDRISGGSVQFG